MTLHFRNREGQKYPAFRVVGPGRPLPAAVGSDVVLPCRLSPKNDARPLEIRWIRHQFSETVHHYRAGEDQYGEQLLDYKGRTKLVRDGLADGDINLRITHVRPSDDGQYVCTVENGPDYQEATVELEVTAVGSVPHLSLESYEHGGIRMLCRSAGWYPQPEVLWRDPSGHHLPATSQRRSPDQSGLFAVEDAIVANKPRNWVSGCGRAHPPTSLWSLPTGDTGDVTNSRFSFAVWRKFLLPQNPDVVTLDTDTAHANLVLSNDLRSVRWESSKLSLPETDRRFKSRCCVLGREGFKEGRHCWGVTIEGQAGGNSWWGLGVAKESVEKGDFGELSSEKGVWAVQHRNGQFVSLTSPRTPLALSPVPKSIWVFLERAQGTVTFVDGASGAEFCRFGPVSFGGDLLGAVLKWFCGGDVPTEPPPYQLRFRFCWRTSLLNFAPSRPPEAETEPSNPMAPRRRREKAPCSLCREPFKTLLSFKGCGHGICGSCAGRLRVGATETCPQCLLVPPGDSDGDEGHSSDGGDGNQRPAKPPKKCPEHGEALEMFCREEGRPVCRRCAVSPAHRTHLTVPIEEAAEEHKAKLEVLVKLLQEHKLDLQSQMSQEEKKLDEWKGKTSRESEMLEKEFEKLHDLLYEEEEKLQRRLKGEKKATATKLRSNITQMMEQSQELELLIRKINRRCQQPPLGLLKDVEKLLSRSQNVRVSKPDVVPIDLQGTYDTPTGFIFGFLDQFKVAMTLDPTSAHRSLVVSKDGRSVRHGGERRDVPPAPQRFDPYVFVLGSRRITSGRCYWEVDVGDKTEWDLGVCKEAAMRKGMGPLNPPSGFWRLWLRNNDRYKALTSRPVAVSVAAKPRRVGIYLDYDGGDVTFYDATNRRHLYTYSGAFAGALRPLFSPGLARGGANAEPLVLCCTFGPK
ncbi:putative LOC102088036 [Columba livia]|uniref:Putative LOC102088036 n=1 Tax=Columba livia TaxID=8932 RepID=A0A2I0LID4_COLLI|nr:putative LOC102088036 [Columba livia]